MSLLSEIQKDAIDAGVDISVLLRKCKVLAARLGSREFALWVEHELNGYASKGELPRYRIYNVQAIGDFSGFFGSGMKNFPIPPSCLPEEYREWATTVYLMAPISTYVSALKNKRSSLDFPWSPDLIRLVHGDILENMTLIAARQPMSIDAVAALLDTVTNRVLSFVLEIQAEAPDAGEAEPNTRPIPEERVTQIFNTYIQGSVANLAAGSQTVVGNTQMTVVQNDLGSLVDCLRQLGLETPDIDELRDAIVQEPSPTPRGDVGPKVANWIGKMVAKAGNGVFNVTTSVAAQVLAKALCQYYGLK